MKECDFSFHIIYLMFIFPSLINPELCCSEEVVVLNLCKITESRNQKLKVEILHDLKEF